ncbi:MAG TPA: amidase [Caldimonas sp.]|nr:amidase [Caldimonas sp.]HEX4233616.1 amidase [Caldimonas sp.]
MQRRTLLISAASLLATEKSAMAATRLSPTSPMVAQPSAVALAAAIAGGKLSAERLVRDCLARIAAIDKAGPRINGILELNPEAIAIARALDAERRSGRVRGPLHGLPVLVKDNVATGDRMSTSAGSLALAGVPAPRDAHVVKRLRDAGAVILGKTNLSEWANIRSTRSTSGWSARGGLTRNPYALDRNTSGSSSGTGAAIAAGLAPLGVGTETDGSIVSPASICGLVGLKPTVGRMSRDGIVPIAHSQDTPGPMTRTVADAALLYAAMSGADDGDAATAAVPADRAAASTVAFPEDALRGARLGVARSFFTGFDEADGLIEQAIVVCKRLGAEIVDPVDLAQPSYNDAELRVLLYELKADLPKYLASFASGAAVKTLADVIAFNRAHHDREMAWFGQELFEKAEALGGLDSKEYLDALAECRKGARDDGIDRVLKANRLDALVAPTGGLAWLIDPVNGDHVSAGFSTPAAVAGYPHLTVPAGLVRGLPIGLSFVGPAWSEERLLALGNAYEKATALRREPTYTRITTPQGS